MNEDYRLAKVYADLGNIEAAVELFSKCMTAFPNSIKPYLRAAECFFAMDKVRECERCLHSVLQLPGLQIKKHSAAFGNMVVYGFLLLVGMFLILLGDLLRHYNHYTQGSKRP